MADVAAVAEQDVADKPLLRLREDIQLLPGTRAWHGGVTWTIADPVRSRFFQISETDMQLLVRWSKGTANALVQSMHDELGVTVSADDVLEFQAFLVSSELIDASIMPVRDRLLTVSATRQQTLFQILLHKYLFFRVPLVRPDAFLSWLYPLVRFLFMPWVPRLGIALGLVGMLLVARNWEQFISGFSWLMTPGGMVAFAITLAIVKVIHEMGHALMCKHFGLRVPTMGVAFLVMWPVLYTDASEGWRLVSRRQRALIAAAGVMTELYLAAIAMVAWFFLPDGIAKGVAFVVATTTWILSVAVNLNPLMRFDGYYFLSDLVNVPNLQDRSFAVARWKLRQWLWGIEQPCPEAMPASALRWMAIYAWSIWIYRFFLFLGIAFLVYHFFFKVLGIFLFMVEISWFIVRPIWGEVKAWREIAPGASFHRRRLLWGMAAGVFVLLAFPWQTSVNLPALLSAQKVSRLFVPADAELVAVHIKDGESVNAGQLLFELRSPELEMRQRVVQADIQRLQAALVAVSVDDALYRDRLVLEQELARAYAGQQALTQELDRLMVRAPFAGRVKDMTLYGGMTAALYDVGGGTLNVTKFVLGFGEPAAGAAPRRVALLFAHPDGGPGREALRAREVNRQGAGRRVELA
ncbi:MAG: biotin/lipoyl-binding protein, partial [Moraxellaceae bacterium]